MDHTYGQNTPLTSKSLVGALLGRFVGDTDLHITCIVIYLIPLYNAQYNLTINTVCKNTVKCAALVAYVF